MKSILTLFLVFSMVVTAGMPAAFSQESTDKAALEKGSMPATIRPGIALTVGIDPLLKDGELVAAETPMVSKTQPLLVSVTLADYRTLNDKSENDAIESMLTIAIPEALRNGRMTEAQAKIYRDRLEKKRRVLPEDLTFPLGKINQEFVLVAIRDDKEISLPWQCLEGMCQEKMVKVGPSGNFGATFGVDAEALKPLADGQWQLQARFAGFKSDGRVLTLTTAPYSTSPEKIALYRGTYYLYKHDYARVLAETTVVIKSASRSVGLWHLKGDALAGLGRSADALIAYEQALALFWDQKPAPQEPPTVLMSQVDRLRRQLAKSAAPASIPLKPLRSALGV